MKEEKLRQAERCFKEEKRAKAERLFREFDTIGDSGNAEKQMLILCN
jgi:Tfp pilus assembly protein PilF